MSEDAQLLILGAVIGLVSGLLTLIVGAFLNLWMDNKKAEQQRKRELKQIALPDSSLQEIKALARRQALKYGMSSEKAVIMADALIGELALTEEEGSAETADPKESEPGADSAE